MPSKRTACTGGARACLVGVALATIVAGTGTAQAAGCAALHVMAQQHANDMARRESLDHDGFFSYRGPRGAMAENVAVGCATEACAREVWLKSPPHRANMMLGGCQAVASAVSKSGRRYWSMEIGGAGNTGPEKVVAHRHARRVAGNGDEFYDFGRGAELR